MREVSMADRTIRIAVQGAVEIPGLLLQERKRGYSAFAAVNNAFSSL
jgi:hypothetical protein